MQTAAYESFQSARYFSGLDALRALSVIAVIWTHTTLPHAMRLLNQGHRGVDLFFAISGFLVTTLLLREYRRERTISLRDFYMRRTLRIFPLYYAALAVYCMLVFVLLKGTPKAAEFWNNLPAFLSYTSNWFVNLENGGRNGVTFYFAWSLATEEQFYLFWPLLMVGVLQWRPRTEVLLVPVIALLLVQAIAPAIRPGAFGAVVLGSLSPAILFGVLFAILLDNRATFSVLYRVLGRRWMPPLIAITVVVCLAFDVPWRVSSFCMAALVASVCIREGSYLHPLLRFKPLMYIGTVSYGIYLMHMLAANAARKVLGYEFGTTVFLATVPVAIAIAVTSYRFFEKPILGFKNRFSHASAKPGVVAGLTGAAS